MTASPIYSIWCDHEDGCTDWIGEGHTPAEAREEAKRRGWTRRRVEGRRRLLDLCPRHSKESSEVKYARQS